MSARHYTHHTNTIFHKRYDAIVIGIGGMGSSAMYYLAREGKRVLGLEKYDIPHDQGSSHGHTRIIRLAYYEHPAYVMLLKRAYELWREIQRHSGEHLLHITGSIDAGPADSWVFKGSLRSCIEHGLQHEVLTGLEIAERFPGYRLPHETMAIFQPEGGFLAPERCIVSYVQAAQALGAEVHGREEVLEWEPTADGVRVYTDRTTYEADRLIITAGAWNENILDVLRGIIIPERQVLAWLQPERPEKFRPDNFPVFNLLVEEGRFYGFPIYAVPGFKFGKYHHLEESGRAGDLDWECYPEDEAMLRDFASRYFPEGAGPTMSLKVCMFTNTPDSHFIIDLHPDYPQVSFASACSGHGFKFASVIGEILADLAVRGRSRHEIDLFRLDRFRGITSSRPVGLGHYGDPRINRLEEWKEQSPPYEDRFRRGGRYGRYAPAGQSHLARPLRSQFHPHGTDRGSHYYTEETGLIAPLDRDAIEPPW